MAKIELGNGYDDSKSSLEVFTDGGPGLTVKGGDRHDRATQDVRIEHASGRPRSDSEGDGRNESSARANGRGGSGPARSGAGRVWAVGSFLLVTAGIVVTLYAVVARAISPLALPIVIAAALLCTYLVALFVVPAENAKGVAGFQKPLSEFLKLLGSIRGKRSGPS